jgi:hypothetical protein
VANPNGAGFLVKGTHSYREEGLDNLRVTIVDDTATAVVQPQATVADAPLTLAVLPLASTEGQSFSGGVVANLHDNDTYGTTSDYTATIDWGDGTTEQGTVAADGAGGFNISAAAHPTDEEAVDLLAVTVIDNENRRPCRQRHDVHVRRLGPTVHRSQRLTTLPASEAVVSSVALHIRWSELLGARTDPLTRAILPRTENAALPSSLSAVLTWNSTACATQTHSISGRPGGPPTIAAQVPTPSPPLSGISSVPADQLHGVE